MKPESTLPASRRRCPERQLWRHAKMQALPLIIAEIFAEFLFCSA
jgi:hypothetical protein